MKFINIINAYNEGVYKVLVLFGVKFRIRSKILKIRHRLADAENRCRQLERKIAEQKKDFSAYQQFVEKQFADFEQRVAERFNEFENGAAVTGKKIEAALSHLSDSVGETAKRLAMLESLDIDSRCSQNAAEIHKTTLRIAGIENMRWSDVCAQNHQETEALEKRMEELEQLELEKRMQNSEREILDIKKTMGEQQDAVEKKLGAHRESVEKKLGEQGKELQQKMSVQLAPALKKLGVVESGLAEQAELRDSLRKHFLRTTYLGKRFEGWPQSYQKRVLSQYQTLDFNRHDKNRVIVYMTEKTTGSGLADRLRTMLTAYVLAAESSRRFYIYHNYGFDLKEYLRPNQIKWEIDASDIAKGLNKVYSIFLLRQYEDLSNCQRECHIFQSCTDIDTDFLPPGLEKKYTSHEVFHHLFKFTPKVKNAARKAMREQSLRKKGYIAVHIRFLNFFEPVEKGGCVTSTEVERKRMVRKVQATLEKIHRETRKQILLFSDSNAILAVQYPDYAKTLNGVVGHVVRHNGNEDIVLKSFVDLLVMSQARAVYSVIGENIYEATVSQYGGQRNGFAKTAAYIGNVPFVRYQLCEHPSTL